MYGFPKELYEISYDTAGSPDMAKISRELISVKQKYDNAWGIDHGHGQYWFICIRKEILLVFQISVDADAPQQHITKSARTLVP